MRIELLQDNWEGVTEMKRAIVTAVAALALNVLFVSQTVAFSDGTYDYIAKVQIANDGYLYINAPGNFNNHDNCTCPQPATPACLGPWYAVSKNPITNDVTKAQLQVALASYLGHKSVYVVTDGCRADKRLLLDAIQIQQP